MANTYLPPTLVIPGTLLISAITKALNAVVTIVDSDENTYIEGQLLYFSVPRQYGMFQINGQYGKITGISGTDFTVDINTLYFDSFVVPGSPKGKPATVTPGGSRNLEYSNLTRRVPFQSLNNIGN